MNHKILAIIQHKGNGSVDSPWDQEFWVLERAPEYVCRRNGDAIVCSDGAFLKLYYHEEPVRTTLRTFAAFGGAKFEIKLEDGTVEKCYGQWWDGFHKDAEPLTRREAICSIGIATNDELKRYFVFYGGRVYASDCERLRAEYRGPIYTYRDYQKVIDLMKRVDARRAKGAA